MDSSLRSWEISCFKFQHHWKLTSKSCFVPVWRPKFWILAMSYRAKICRPSHLPTLLKTKSIYGFSLQLLNNYSFSQIDLTSSNFTVLVTCLGRWRSWNSCVHTTSFYVACSCCSFCAYLWPAITLSFFALGRLPGDEWLVTEATAESLICPIGVVCIHLTL